MPANIIIPGGGGGGSGTVTHTAGALFLYGSTGFDASASRDASYHVFAFTSSGGLGNIYYDGTNMGSGATNFSLSGLNIATNTLITGFYKIDALRMLVWNSLLNSTQIASAQAYLKSLYGTP
jgi:hypothetical protein